MNKIIINENVIFTVNNFNKNASFNGDVVRQGGHMNIVANSIDELYNLAHSTIASIEITHDDESIYSNTGLTGHISNITEYLSEDKVIVDVDLIFE